MTRLRGVVALVAATFVLLSTLAPFGAVGTAGAVPDARITVTDTTVSPATPTTGAPVTATFDDPGAYSLAVVAVGDDADGDTVTARRPLSLVVEAGAPQVEFDAESPAVGSPVEALRG